MKTLIRSMSQCTESSYIISFGIGNDFKNGIAEYALANVFMIPRKMLPLNFVTSPLSKNQHCNCKETISGNTCIKVCRSRNNKDQPTDSSQYTRDDNPGITNLRHIYTDRICCSWMLSTGAETKTNLVFLIT